MKTKYSHTHHLENHFNFFLENQRVITARLAVFKISLRYSVLVWCLVSFGDLDFFHCGPYTHTHTHTHTHHRMPLAHVHQGIMNGLFIYVKVLKLSLYFHGVYYLLINTYSRKILKKISVGEIQPNETVEAVREAALLAQVKYFKL